MVATLTILEKPIVQLPTSDEFLEMANRNKFRNLAQLLKYPVHELLKLESFNYHILDELIMILKTHDLLDELKEN
jgi:hypothetical protein